MQNYAILTNGGYAKRKLGPAVRPATAQDFTGLVQTLESAAPLDAMRLHPVYYSDSVPLETAHDKPLNGGRIEFGYSPVANRSRKLSEQFAKRPFTALQPGASSFEGWVVSGKALNTATGRSLEITGDDLKPQISQKGGDLRIGKVIDHRGRHLGAVDV
jgi:hypothetical protein